MEQVPPVPTPPPDAAEELRQVRAELAEVKQLMVKIRRSQKLATWMGVLKVLVYLGLVGAATVALRGILANGLGAITATGLYGDLGGATSTGSLPAGLNFDELMKSVQQLQGGQ